MGGGYASLDELARVIDVVDEQVQGLGALLYAAVDDVPLGAGENARHEIERDQAFRVSAFAVDRECDADPPEHRFGFGFLAAQFFEAQPLKPLRDGFVPGANLAVQGHFVECWRRSDHTLPISPISALHIKAASREAFQSPVSPER